MHSIRSFAGACSLVVLAACASSATQNVGDRHARIRADVAWLADDARMGREPGTKGYDDAADYVLERMKAVGLKPADTGWRQERAAARVGAHHRRSALRGWRRRRRDDARAARRLHDRPQL